MYITENILIPELKNYIARYRLMSMLLPKIALLIPKSEKFSLFRRP